MDNSDYKTRWKALDHARRKAIYKALQRGERLPDRHERALVVYLAAKRLRQNWMLLALPFIIAISGICILIVRGATAAQAITTSVVGSSLFSIFPIRAWKKWNVVLIRADKLNRDARDAGND